jgi:hypothetical protein
MEEFFYLGIFSNLYNLSNVPFVYRRILFINTFHNEHQMFVIGNAILVIIF